ncbi:MmgE/PrpD family protein, partial [Thermodesulfobacteriota bacterium]
CCPFRNVSGTNGWIETAGSLEPAGSIITEVVRNEGGHPVASIVGGGFKTSALNAALANGVMAPALDFDDGGHPNIPSRRSVTVFPAVLALGESIGATGKRPAPWIHNRI